MGKSDGSASPVRDSGQTETRLNYMIDVDYTEKTGSVSEGRKRPKASTFFYILIVLSVLVVGLYPKLLSSLGVDVTASTIKRQALPAGISKGDILRFEVAPGASSWFADKATLEDGATKAYNLTGVKYGICVKLNINGKTNPSAAEMTEYATSLYSCGIKMMHRMYWC